MDPRELLDEALRAIRSHPLRSFLTLLGIIIGVATLVGVVSVISGLNAYVTDKVFALSPDVFVISKFGIIRSREEFIARVSLVPIPSLWGHPAGAGGNPADRAFLNDQITRFLRE